MNHLPGETERCHYDYDPLDRQSASTHIAQLTRQRFHCKNRLATELQGTTRRSIFQFDDQLLAQQNYLAANVTATLLATDHSRSVLNALDAAKIHSLAYSPYGHRPAQSGLLSLLGFNGEQPDPMTGHYHLGNGYRQFNPVLMRFNSPDSWSPFGDGGINAYAYCVGDPVNNEDRNGHMPRKQLFTQHVKKPTATPLPQPAQMGSGALSPPPLPPREVVKALSPPPLPPRGVPKDSSSPPPRPTVERKVFPPKNFEIMEGGFTWIPLPHSRTHAYNARVPLSLSSISTLRRAGVHIHPALLEAPATGAHVNRAFVPETPQPKKKTPGKTMSDVRKQ